MRLYHDIYGKNQTLCLQHRCYSACQWILRQSSSSVAIQDVWVFEYWFERGHTFQLVTSFPFYGWNQQNKTTVVLVSNLESTRPHCNCEFLLLTCVPVVLRGFFCLPSYWSAASVDSLWWGMFLSVPAERFFNLFNPSPVFFLFLKHTVMCLNT